MDNVKEVVARKAPKAIGPYSQAIQADGKFMFMSGQIPIDPSTGDLVKGDIVAQTKQVIANIKAILTAEALALSHVVKTTVFLTDLNDFAAFNDVYGSAFSKPYPARSTIQVAALPKGAKIEIEAVALVAHD